MKAHVFWESAMVLILCCTVGSLGQTKRLPANKDGIVPDAKTAIKIAEAVLEPIYGEDQVTSERPYRADLVDGLWVVTGTLHGGTFVFGGVAHVKISQATGQIEELWHSK